jgi:hypothetical protein
MAGSKSKNKGSSFERVIAKDLNELYGIEGGFSRSSGSGARFGGKNKVNLNVNNRQASKGMLGDIQTPDGVDLIIECKSYKDFPFHQLIQGECKVIDGWLDQLEGDINTFKEVFHESIPGILVFKINSKGTYVATSDVFIHLTLDFEPYVAYKKYVIMGWDLYKKKVKDSNLLIK